MTCWIEVMDPCASGPRWVLLHSSQIDWNTLTPAKWRR